MLGEDKKTKHSDPVRVKLFKNRLNTLIIKQTLEYSFISATFLILL